MSALLAHIKAYRVLAAAYDRAADQAAGGHTHGTVNILRFHARVHRDAADELERQMQAGCSGEESAPAHVPRKAKARG